MAHIPPHLPEPPGRNRSANWCAAKAHATCKRGDDYEHLWQRRVDGKRGGEFQGGINGFAETTCRVIAYRGFLWG